MLLFAEEAVNWGEWGMTGAIFWIVLGVIALTGIILGTISKVMINRAREQTRREIAAYVAEGSIKPDDAVKMLKAGRSSDDIAAELPSCKVAK